MEGTPVGVWGKLRQDEAGRVTAWHPLVAHCADVAACCEALLDHTIVRRRLAQLSDLDDLGPVQRARLCVLAALHDAGKCNHGFQRKADTPARDLAGHVGELFAILSDAGSPEQTRLVESLRLAEIDGWGGLELLAAALAHHGAPEVISAPRQFPRNELWRSANGRDPTTCVAAIAKAAWSWFPSAASDAAPFPEKPELQHAFSGLVTLADWVGSDEALFPYAETPGDDRIEFARERAAVAVRRLWIDPAEARAAVGGRPPGFAQLFGHGFEARPAQRALFALGLPPGGGLAILEAETGSGKTEAAVAHFARLFASGLVDGMYFALPTRTSATQIQRRLVAYMARWFPDEAARPPVVLAVPGYLRVDGIDGNRNEPTLAPFRVLWSDDEGDRKRWRGWAVENPKRYLAGTVVVGTIDQVLLSALPVKHAHLRATALLRHLLVVDEIHASDAYMNRLLDVVLKRHLAAGGHALLMSATLGASAREHFLRGSQERDLPGLEECIDVEYPCISTVGRTQEKPQHRGVVVAGEPKRVGLEPRPAISEPGTVASEALDAARRGARVLVIRNTVGGALETQVAMEHAAGDAERSLLFSCNDLPAPHHSRFAASDRKLLDAAIEQAYGKDGYRERCVVIATQTVQQSLDLDADLLITDLCPMDVLLQRIGRLHRHATRTRPMGFDKARAVVLVPEDRDLVSFIGKGGKARGPHGLGTVYSDLRILEATRRIVQDTREIAIPEMNRWLVERTTHRDALAAITRNGGDAWESHARHVGGETIAKKALAATNAFDWSKPFGAVGFPTGMDEMVKTRLGAGDRIVQFEHAFATPLGATTAALTLPAWFADGAGPDERPTDVAVSAGSVTFRFGQRRFLYDRLGLRPEARAASREQEDRVNG